MTLSTHPSPSVPSPVPGKAPQPALPSPVVVLPDALVETLAAQIAQSLAAQTVIHLCQNAKGRAQFEAPQPYPAVEVAKA